MLKLIFSKGQHDNELPMLLFKLARAFIIDNYRPGHPNLDFHSRYAFIKKYTIFTQWLWNSVKIKYSWALNFYRVS